MKINSISVKLNDSVKFVESNVRLQLKDKSVPRIYIEGAPGCGKSDLLRQVCEKNGWGLAVRYISNLVIEQLTGLPVKPEAGKEVDWSKAEIFNFKDMDYAPAKYKVGTTPTVLLLDDFHLSDRTMQRYMFQLLTYLKINSSRLPENSAIILAGNRMNDKAGALPIPAPVCNRMFFVDVHSDSEDWLKNFALVNGVRGDICTFIHNHPQYLHGDPIETTAWASPRSWAYLSKQMDQFENDYSDLNLDELRIMASGLVGEEIAGEFIMYRELFAKWNFAEMFTRKEEEVHKILEQGIMENELNAYAIINAGISWMLSSYKNINYDIKDENMKKICEFTYNILSWMLTIKNLKVNIGPMIIAGLKYLTILEKNEKISYTYKDLLTEFFSNMAKAKRNCDYIFLSIICEITGRNPSDEQKKKIENAKKSLREAA